MNMPCICVLSEENGQPAPICEPPTMTSPGCDNWRETTLQRLEAWIEERERLVAEIELRIQEQALAEGPEGGGHTTNKNESFNTTGTRTGGSRIGSELAPEALENIVFEIGYRGSRGLSARSG